LSKLTVASSVLRAGVSSKSATANAVEGVKTQSAAKLMAAANPGQAQMERLLRMAIRFPIADVVVIDVRKAPQ
jgi:phage tail protein X